MPASKEKGKYGTWRYQKSVKNSLTGETVRLRKKGFRTKAEAELAEALAISELSNKPIVYNSLYFKVIIDDYLELKKATTRSRSVQKKERMINQHIIPILGDEDMNIFNPSVAKHFYDYVLMLDSSINFKNELIRLTKSIFYHGELHFGISAQPIRRLSLLKVNKSSTKEFKVYDIEEFLKYDSTFPSVTENDLALKTFFNVLFWTGMRRGEAKGLKWNDINFTKKEIRVDEQFVDKDPILGRTLCDVKTPNSNRTILTEDYTFELLKILKDFKMKDINFSEDNLIFLRKNSVLPFADTSIDRINSEHAKLAKLKHIRVHDFRHSFASVNFSLEVDVATISRMMGHSSISITINTYVSMMSKKNKERVEKINNARMKLLTSK